MRAAGCCKEAAGHILGIVMKTRSLDVPELSGSAVNSRSGRELEKKGSVYIK